MKNFHSKITAFLFSVLFLGLAVTAPGQEQDPATEEQGRQVFYLTLQGRDITVRDGETAEERPFQPATGGPLEIGPNPYLDRETFKGRSFRLVQQEENLGPGKEKTAEVEQTELDPLNLDAIGLLAAGGTGYPIDLWQGSDVRELLVLISALPGGTSSPTANAIKRKLLLSSAPFPITPESGVEIEDLLFQRLAQLYRAGDLASLLSLFEQIPAAERSPRISRMMVEAYLLDGDMESACALAKTGQREEGTPDWLKITSICLVLEGEEDQARFNLTLLTETGDMDFAYQSLFEGVVKLVSEERGEISTLAMEEGDGGFSNFFSGQFFLLSELTPLHVAILKLLGRNVEIALDENAGVSSVLLSALARWSGLTLETKLEVADQALAGGILEEHFLSTLVGAYTFSPQDKETAYLLDYESWGVKSDALFYALAKEAFDFDAAIKHIREGWARARYGGRAAFMAGLYMDAMAEIPPDSAYISFAPDAVRIALLTGNWQVALYWYQTVHAPASTGDAEATRMLVEMWPLMVTMDQAGEIPYSPQILRLWRRSLEILPVEDQVAQTQVFYKILEVLGLPVPDDLKSEGLLILGETSGPEFIGGASLGETILRILTVFGAAGAEKAAPMTVANVMYTLTEAGLEAEARQLGLEALLARGF